MPHASQKRGDMLNARRDMDMKRIAVVTSGGDAPGMNAAVRALVRAATAEQIEVLGVRNGFSGLVAGDFDLLDTRAVAGIMQRGGTILGSTRYRKFSERATQEEAIARLADVGVDG